MSKRNTTNKNKISNWGKKRPSAKPENLSLREINLTFGDKKITFEFAGKTYEEKFPESYPELNKLIIQLVLPYRITIDSSIPKLGAKSKNIIKTRILSYNESLKNKINIGSQISVQSLIQKGELARVANKNLTSKKKKRRQKNKKKNQLSKILNFKDADLNDTIISSDWNKIIFREEEIEFDFNNEKFRFHEELSETYLEYIKTIFIERRYKYSIQFKKGKPLKIDLPKSIFKLIELGKVIYAKGVHQFISNISANSLNPKQLGISYKELFRLFKIGKPYYLDYLCKVQSKKHNLICIYEPILQDNSFVRNDLSFLFISTLEGNVIGIWESVHLNKATYVFFKDNKGDKTDTFIANVQDFLSREIPLKRYNLRAKRFKIDGVKSYKGINHKYEDGHDYHWRWEIGSVIGL